MSTDGSATATSQQQVPAGSTATSSRRNQVILLFLQLMTRVIWVSESLSLYLYWLCVVNVLITGYCVIKMEATWYDCWTVVCLRTKLSVVLQFTVRSSSVLLIHRDRKHWLGRWAQDGHGLDFHTAPSSEFYKWCKPSLVLCCVYAVCEMVCCAQREHTVWL